jgi:SAM-dependent methyltransferase
MVGADEDHEAGAGGYVLGHAAWELKRLALQARLIDPITDRFLRDGGITTGMRVLDIGSGGGHVAFLAAAIVGASGEVLGVDRSAKAVASARAEARARSLANVAFLVGDPVEMVFDQPFDALIGRYVLQFQADPARALRTVAGHVRPGGAVVFHELDWSGAWSAPPSPTYDRLCGWAVQTLKLSGAETQMGLKLFSTFVSAGLPPPLMRLEAVIGGGPNAAAVCEQLLSLVETLSSAMRRLGIARADDLDHDSLFNQIMDETAAAAGVILGRLQVGCWSHT